MNPRVFVAIPTHTTRHLACCLASLAHQSLAPAAVVLTCDVDKPQIAALAREVWAGVTRARVAAGRAPIPLLHTSRPHQGVAQLNQVRNNALRAIAQRLSPDPDDLIVMLDGDTMLAHDALQVHQSIRRQGAEVIVAYRAELTEPATAPLTAPNAFERLLADERLVASLIDAPDRAKLAARQRRYQRHLWWRAIGLAQLTGKGHKPKLLGGHHAVGWRALAAVNAYDELYKGYRFDDDDLSRRLLALRPKLAVAVAVNTALAVHLWHPTRATEPPEQSPGYARWTTKGLPIRCEHGLENPQPQPSPQIVEIEPLPRASPAS